MKKNFFTAAIALTIAGSLMMTSCIGSFRLTHKVLEWNDQIGGKFVNELVFIAFWILPVYELSAMADILVINSIEFWSGNNPIAYDTKIIDGKDARYEIISNPGITAPIIPHSRPAWITFTSGSSPNCAL